MIIYIKENGLVTEFEYTEELIQELLDDGYQAVEVPEMDLENPYQISDFEFVDDTWKLKERQE
jgi:hypothetical protein